MKLWLAYPRRSKSSIILLVLVLLILLYQHLSFMVKEKASDDDVPYDRSFMAGSFPSKATAVQGKPPFDDNGLAFNTEDGATYGYHTYTPWRKTRLGDVDDIKPIKLFESMINELFRYDGQEAFIDAMPNVMKPCTASFLVIGAQKSGTSSLHAWLKEISLLNNGTEPQLQLPRFQKELNLFSERIPHWLAWRGLAGDEFTEKKLTDANLRARKNVAWVPKNVMSFEDLIKWYISQFTDEDIDLWQCDAKSEFIRGEVSPNYLSSPFAPILTRMILGTPKLVVVLRDPFQRAVSSFNMRWQVRNCPPKTAWMRSDCYKALYSNETELVWWAESWSRELLKTIREQVRQVRECQAARESNWIAKEFTSSSAIFKTTIGCIIPSHELLHQEFSLSTVHQIYADLEGAYVHRSLYAEQLKLWFSYIAPENFLILPFKDFEQDTARVLLNDVGPFIGYDFSRAVNIDTGKMMRHQRRYITDELDDALAAKANDDFDLARLEFCLLFQAELDDLESLLQRHSKRTAERVMQTFDSCK